MLELKKQQFLEEVCASYPGKTDDIRLEKVRFNRFEEVFHILRGLQEDGYVQVTGSNAKFISFKVLAKGFEHVN